MRRYVPVLVDALPELFFFAYTGERAYTLKAIALCLSVVDVKLRKPNKDNKIHVEFSTKEFANLLDSHFLGLNQITEWLNMPIEENKRISFVRSF